MIEVDARGLSCPEPLLLTKNALNQGGSVRVLVDDACARGNIEKLAKSLDKKITVKDNNGETEMVIE